MAYSILCVDDEDQILAIFQRVFEDLDFVFYTAKNGIDALIRVREYYPDIVFLDVAMPQMSGDEALPLIHEIDPTIAVVIVSGKITADEARDLLAQGAYDFLQKPIDLQHLRDFVEQWRVKKELS